MKKVVALLVIAVCVLILAAAFYATTSRVVNPDGSVFIANFNRALYGDNITGGNLTLVNPTSSKIEGLQLTVEVDGSTILIENLRSTSTVTVHDLNNHSFPFSLTDNFTLISLDANQTKSFQFNLANQTRTLTVYSQHLIKIYLSKDKPGDVINGETFTMKQEKAYLQILNYSTIEHSNDTWHRYYNQANARYEYVNDNPNFYQQYHHNTGATLEANSFQWAQTLNQIGETYFNITVHNNSTFPVNDISFSAGETVNQQSLTASAVLDKPLQPNETCIIPVSLTAVPRYGYASGNIDK